MKLRMALSKKRLSTLTMRGLRKMRPAPTFKLPKVGFSRRTRGY